MELDRPISIYKPKSPVSGPCPDHGADWRERKLSELPEFTADSAFRHASEPKPVYSAQLWRI